MRGSAWIVVSVLALAAAACSPKPQTAAAPPPAPPAAAPAPALTPAAAPEAPPAAEPTPPPPPPPTKTEAIRFSRTDYGARERRLSALIANAETRDTTGETQYRAAEGRAQRQRCTTKACIERSYAVEEAWLRKWEGSGDAR
jgi:hypothetical protein